MILTVNDLIEMLKLYPEDYVIWADTLNDYCSFVYVTDIEVDDEQKMIKIKLHGATGCD